MRRIFASAAALFFGALLACGSSSDDSGASSTSAVTSTEDAGDAATLDLCTPCNVRYAAGAATYETARRRCFCADDVCHSPCAGTQCMVGKSLPANEACTSCINDSYGKCVQVVEAACESDPECTRYVLCKLPDSCKK